MRDEYEYEDAMCGIPNDDGDELDPDWDFETFDLKERKSHFDRTKPFENPFFFID
eukprot:CAMPEP_0113885694 /NCGR_PEP_ID=MMETSP0780_2-20120614/11071_1 /TAXON_ID=652834 /ORGANISM="Palpitomonas bilix" /LENGTH=54 /DNA_ID=CAMNT_0000873685 /DNA_START=448 /DNA_END=612 /DNA_ORIENTATION=+ /assembly_acc=CAM_ASM_000599